MNKSNKLAVIVATVLLALGAVSSFAAENAKVAGNWAFAVESPNGTATPSASIQQDGDKLTGTYKGRFGESALTGTVKGNDIKFSTDINTPNGTISIEYAGTVDGDTIKGTASFGPMGEAPFTGKRAAAK